MDFPEYKKRIIYQIYPLSFKDSNNDGYGDLNGIISKLDYLKDLGIGIIWLSPIYASPMHDNGYDISDYYSINPLFGTMEDFDNLIKEADKRDIKIVMDLVINHTSNQHIWFKEALKNPNSKYRNYYIFKKGNGNKVPNNWDSAFTGCPWEKVENEDNMYYLHLYAKEQPDLNYRNEEVIKEVENILEFYLKKGVYGFRCDVINQIYKTSFDNGKFRFFQKGKEFYENQEENFKILERFQRTVKKYNGFLVGETSNVTPEIGNKFLSRGCLDMFFEFEHSFCDEFKLIPIFKLKYKPYKLINPILKWQEKVPWIGAYLENHDQRRSLSRWGYKDNLNKSAKALSMFLLTLKGTPFIFEGEELGALDYEDLTYEETNDKMSLTIVDTAAKILHISKEKAFKLVNSTVNRDHSRFPMLWSNSINGGFNEGAKTWLKVNDIYKKYNINVEDELKDSNSVLNFYKEIIKFRNSNDVLKFGDFIRVKSNKNVAKFTRTFNEETLLIVINLSNKKVKDIREEKEVLFTNDKDINSRYLNPLQGIIYKLR